MKIPSIEVGILSSESIHFKLNGEFRRMNTDNDVNMGEGTATATGESAFILNINGKEQIFDDYVILEPLDENAADFELHEVVIGVQFHWERKESQRFKGKLKIYVEKGKLTAVNILSLEDYLLSVISSEMSATSSPELLKAHAVISRSWLLAQMEKGKRLKNADYKTFVETNDGYIRWYDREDHSRFDVCADDHCQRYQGITRVSSKQVYEALQATFGKVLMFENAVCDARFYKCCGGITEKFEHVWEPVPHSYLTQVVDSRTNPDGYNIDLTQEKNAAKWILSNPPAFCNTHDKKVLSQVLNDYDQETQNFYRWENTLTQTEIKDLLLRKIGIDVGEILDLVPVERGVSGRLIRLKIVGSDRSVTIGKELEIRKALSESHLYSSAFVVEKRFAPDNKTNIPTAFILKGAGWGHGVGLCQIGAAIMSAEGYSYEEILAHYFPTAELEQIY